jgi:hypothetical protein
MNISREFQEVRVFLADYRLVAVLEQMSDPFVAPVKVDHITG